MNKLMLGNIDYARHTTDEGEQLQQGLRESGWTLFGPGYPAGCASVRHALDLYKPDVVLVHDKRDWDAKSCHSYRKDVGFKGLGELKGDGIKTGVVLKDAGGEVDYQRQFAEECGASYAVIYYDPERIAQYQPWTSGLRLVRTWHSLDPDAVNAAIATRDWTDRQGVIVSGARAHCYPLRRAAFAAACDNGWHRHNHPGYGNKGCAVPDYLKLLVKYRVSIATASCYGFALRKIIESVACGCTPVTNLQETDILPEIDDALVRVGPEATFAELKEAVTTARNEWDPDVRLALSKKAIEWYDYLKVTARLDEEITR